MSELGKRRLALILYCMHPSTLDESSRFNRATPFAVDLSNMHLIYTDLVELTECVYVQKTSLGCEMTGYAELT